MNDLFKNLIAKCFPNGMSEEKRLDIMGFISEKLYNDYNEYCMNREMVIKKQNQYQKKVSKRYLKCLFYKILNF